jgi:hypothetical protein
MTVSFETPVRTVSVQLLVLNIYVALGLISSIIAFADFVEIGSLFVELSFVVTSGSLSGSVVTVGDAVSGDSVVSLLSHETSPVNIIDITKRINNTLVTIFSVLPQIGI